MKLNLSNLLIAATITAIAYVLWIHPMVTQQQTKTNPENAIVANFNLTDHHGNQVTQDSYAGKKLLVYFGFSHCPDMCPTDLAVISKVMPKLPEGHNVQPIFITVDPERDTPEQLASYLQNFDQSIIGLTGSQENIDHAVKAFKVYYQKTTPQDMDGYMFNHSGYMYLMDEKGQFITHFSHGQDATTIAKMLLNYL
tara:strand:+ start:106 stop:693 length:588 start_codon:yes stop_codon:yes gene_type:complete